MAVYGKEERKRTSSSSFLSLSPLPPYPLWASLGGLSLLLLSQTQPRSMQVLSPPQSDWLVALRRGDRGHISHLFSEWPSFPHSPILAKEEELPLPPIFPFSLFKKCRNDAFPTNVGKLREMARVSARTERRRRRKRKKQEGRLKAREDRPRCKDYQNLLIHSKLSVHLVKYWHTF